MSSSVIRPERGIFVNRTINLRSIKAIGYDMDYTLVHYHVDEWETRAFAHAKSKLLEMGYPVEDIKFDSDAVIRGLAIDLEEGNLVKATRFGYVIRAAHGTSFLGYDEMRRTYAGTMVDLSEDRFEFVNTLFSLSEASLYAQLVDLMDAGRIEKGIGYRGLYQAVISSLDGAHQDGDLKQDILDDPARFIEPDPDGVMALVDQLRAGKRLMLITNSEWEYTVRIMEYAFDPYLPPGMKWRDLFEAIIVSADKPAFFTSTKQLYKVVDEEAALLRPHIGAIEPGSVFFGGCARQVEEFLGLSGDEILYVGDHLFGDVHFSKALLRWRTALILRELESEVASLRSFRPDEVKLEKLMAQKSALEAEVSAVRLALQRKRLGYAEPPVGVVAEKGKVDSLRADIAVLDEEITPLAVEASRLRNEAWGPLMRAGIDKSLFARQVEKYADCYTSRVANFVEVSPFALLRVARADLPHDTWLD
ncbi:MAG: HAD-IG family 5'-nucleotidase [Acidimicrobiia bacterium]|nr:HAD-IG family 5'-nucleotidase [Acidimicrobiia bacterium]MDX2466254.1 HAD-IG family 5'-nucleotidase [Acidimicrobiia bacterium]